MKAERLSLTDDYKWEINQKTRTEEKQIETRKTGKEDK
jgi:hypothetical protein